MQLLTLASISRLLFKESESDSFPIWLVIVGAVIIYFYIKDKKKQEKKKFKDRRNNERSSYKEKNQSKKSDYWKDVLSESNVSQDYSSLQTYHPLYTWKRLDNAINESRPLKDNYQVLARLIKEKRITCLYHFTDMVNVDSIRRNGGLYSWKSCQRKGIYIPSPGSDNLSRNLDDRKNLGDYVRLSYNPRQPMLYVAHNEGRINTPVILKIDPVVMLWRSTLFSNINAAANAALIGPDVNDFLAVKTYIALSNDWTTQEEKGFFQAEVLVKSHIPLEYITFPSKWW